MEILVKYNLSILIPFSFIGSILLTTSHTESAIYLMILLMGIDFITGLIASFIEEKKEFYASFFSSKNKLINNFLYLSNKGSIYKVRCFLMKLNHIITSDKLKDTIVKVFLYFGTIIITYLFESLFIIKQFKVFFSDLNFTLTLSLVLFCIGREFYSIFFENFKRMGIDVKSVLSKYFKIIKDVKKEIGDL